MNAKAGENAGLGIFAFTEAPNRVSPSDESAASYWNSFIALLMV
jgi:hypothetical protein